MKSKVTSNSLYSRSKLSNETSIPDEPSDEYLPSSDFVLCRNAQGNATAIYGSNTWDFDPYRLGANKIYPIYFDYVFDDNNEKTRSLIGEFKRLLYCLIYYSAKGRTGRLNASTLESYSRVIKKAVRFCYSMRNNPLVGALSLQQLLENKVYLSAFVSANNQITTFNKKFPALLSHCTHIGEDKLGYKVCTKNGLGFGSTSSEQHAVIPTRIYLGMINQWGELLDQFDGHHENTRLFIESFSDKYYAKPVKTQNSLGVGGRCNWRPIMSEALRDHNLDMVFTGTFEVTNKVSLLSKLTTIQLLCKNIINLYTGMRDQEIMRLMCDCVYEENVTSNVDQNGESIADKDRVISIISTTTKFTGYKKQEAWLAPGEVVKAVSLAREISLGLFSLTGKTAQPSEIPLFISTTNINDGEKSTEVSNLTNLSGHLPKFYISAADFEELKLSDPKRDFDAEKDFVIGNPWPLRSHQFRRSLAYYASSSGFVSLPSLKKQFKHLTRQMTQYYRNGFQYLKTIFGFWNDEIGEFVLPDSHIAFEFQTGMNMNVVDQLLNDLLGSDRLFGGTGSYMEKQKQNIANGKITIMEIRKETEKLVKNGDLAFKSTLTGGCTNPDECDKYMLGDFTACFPCPSAIIKEENIDLLIAEDEIEISHYKEGSGEYRATEARLNILKRNKSKIENLKAQDKEFA